MRRRGPRVDMRRIDDATARSLLAQYRSTVAALAARYGGDLVALEDRVQLARIAVLEAHITWRSRLACSRETWTSRVIRWRLAELFEEPQEETEELHENIQNGLQPDERLLREHLRESIGLLDPREANILDARYRGHTLEETATMLRISAARVHQIEQAAIKQLRKLVTDDVQ